MCQYYPLSVILDFSASSSSLAGKITSSNFHIPSRISKRPRKLIGLKGKASKTLNLIILIIIIIVKPRY
jgi:hypothetical protein